MCPLGETAYTYIVIWWKELVLAVEVSRLRKFLSWIAVIGEHSGRNTYFPSYLESLHDASQEPPMFRPGRCPVPEKNPIRLLLLYNSLLKAGIEK